MLKIDCILAKLCVCMMACHHFREKQKYDFKTDCGISFNVEKCLIKYSILTERVKKSVFYHLFIKCKNSIHNK